jgi:hypothetical protein
MGSREEVAVAKAEQTAMRELTKELSRRERHQAAGLVEVVEMYDTRVGDAFETWLSCAQHRMTLACLGMANKPEVTHR